LRFGGFFGNLRGLGRDALVGARHRPKCGKSRRVKSTVGTLDQVTEAGSASALSDAGYDDPAPYRLWER